MESDAKVTDIVDGIGSRRRAIAYARVSTLLGQDPELQLISIRQYASLRGFALVGEYVDKGVCGAKEKRPALDRMIADAKMRRFDIVIVTAIDRVGRNARHLLNLIHDLSFYGVNFISIREQIDFQTPMGQATLTILGAIAQLERELTRERIRSALAAKKQAARSNGTSWRCGRPVVLVDEVISQVRSLHAQNLSIRKIAKQLKISKTSVQRALGVPLTCKKPESDDE